MTVIAGAGLDRLDTCLYEPQLAWANDAPESLLSIQICFETQNERSRLKNLHRSQTNVFLRKQRLLCSSVKLSDSRHDDLGNRSGEEVGQTRGAGS